MLRFWKRNSRGNEILIEERPELEGMELTAENIKNQIGDSSDVIIREFYINGNSDFPVTLVLIDGMVNDKNVDDDILKPLLQEGIFNELKTEKSIIDCIFHGGLYHSSAKVICRIDDCIESIIQGSVALIFDKEQTAVTFDIKGFEKRAISEPTGENVTKGAKDGFIEVLRVNTTLVRRKLRTQNLRIKETKVGQETLTSVAVVYIEGLTNPEIVTELFKRLDSIRTEGVITGGGIEEYIIDNKWALFPQVLYTERTDKFCKLILEGRVGIIIDGLPMAYIVPATFSMFLRSPDDYSNNYVTSSVTRIVRYISYFISLIAPAFYISITTFHQEMIPLGLAITIIKSKSSVPFPTFIEVLLMLFILELIIEAGLRLPKTIGQAVSIVGAVVVGQAAVSAKIISSGIIVIIALTAIAGFTMPTQDFANAVRIWRFILVLCSSVGGLFGLTIGLLVMGHHLSRIETFGVPYMSPYEANEGKNILEDTIFRLPLFIMKKRRSSLKTVNKRLQK